MSGWGPDNSLFFLIPRGFTSGVKPRSLSLVIFVLAATGITFGQSLNLGRFSNQSDVGSIGVPGPASYDGASGQFTITGGGANIWATNDAFHFVWTKMSGDLKFAADVSFVGTNGNAHRKACLMIRQSLDADSAYADVAVHGVGLTALQYRDKSGDATHEIQSEFSAPARVQIEKRGEYFSMSVASAGGNLQTEGGYLRVPITGDFYVGLAVCAHDNRTNAQAVFSNVQLTPLATDSNVTPQLESTLETVLVASTDRQIVYHTTNHLEAPNWSPDNKYLIFNSTQRGLGRMYRLPVAGGTPELIDTGDVGNCNNDHVISPDGKWLGLSASKPGKSSYVFIVPVAGGPARQVTTNGPTYLHGWSPHGETLSIVLREGTAYNLFTVPAAGGDEFRLTNDKGTDDGPCYSTDGRQIYFNSDRSGSAQIWRMAADGSSPEKMTADDYVNWFAHPSPDGRYLVFVSYPKGTSGHPANKDVLVRLLRLSDRSITVLAKLFGGQGTMNVPSWSPDSRQVAFVSYQLVYP